MYNGYMSNVASMIILAGGCAFIALLWWAIVETSAGDAPKWKFFIRALGLILCATMAFFFGLLIAPLLN